MSKPSKSPDLIEVRVLKATALSLQIPASVKHPEKLAERIIRAWPAKHLIAKHRVKVVKVLDGIDHQLCN